MSRSLAYFLTAATALTSYGPTVAQPPRLERPGERVTGVKQKTMFGSEVEWFYGTVEKIDGRLVTARGYSSSDEKPRAQTFEAIDVLANGGLERNATGSFAYLWSDMKTGDTVRLGLVRDEAEDKQYCVHLMIEGRVGGKVPPSQQPEKGVRQLAERNLLNDINNGLDVSDADIAELFPTIFVPVPRGEPPVPPIPGGLPASYQKKLDAVRAKAAVPKATPPEKK